MRQNTGILYILIYKCASRHSGVQFFDIGTSKSAPDRQFFNMLTWKCASRHSGVQFFHIATSKSGPSMQCFVHFDFKMCFSLQRRVIFAHLNFKKCCEPLSFFSIFTSKCASRYSGVQFFHVATSKSGPNMQCFVHFDFKMHFSPQRRAFFPHRNFKKWSEHAVFCTF